MKCGTEGGGVKEWCRGFDPFPSLKIIMSLSEFSYRSSSPLLLQNFLYSLKVKTNIVSRFTKHPFPPCSTSKEKSRKSCNYSPLSLSFRLRKGSEIIFPSLFFFFSFYTETGEQLRNLVLSNLSFSQSRRTTRKKNLKKMRRKGTKFRTRKFQDMGFYPDCGRRFYNRISKNN